MFDYQRVYHIGPMNIQGTRLLNQNHIGPTTQDGIHPLIRGNSSSQVNFYSMEGEQRLCDHIPMATGVEHGASDVWNAIHATIFLDPPKSTGML